MRAPATDPTVHAYDVWIDSDDGLVYELLPASGGGNTWIHPSNNLPMAVSLDYSAVRGVRMVEMCRPPIE